MSRAPVASDSPLSRVLERLQSVKRTGDGWIARCPAHDDRSPSLSIGAGADGRVLLHCFAGCSADAVCGAIGLEPRDLFVPRAASNGTHSRARTGYPTAEAAVTALRAKHGSPAGIWRYTNVDGREVGLAVRFDDSQAPGGKIVLPVSLHCNEWRMRAMPAPRPLYRLPELASAGVIVVCEGEKATDAAAALGFIATTSPGGCLAAGKADWSPLAGREVVLVPDNDAPGHEYIDRVQTELARLSPPPSIRAVALPGVPESGDMVEFIEARSGDVEVARRDLQTLIDEAAQLAPVDLRALVSGGIDEGAGAARSALTADAIATADVVDSSAGSGADPDSWPAPQPIPVPLPRVLAFDPRLLPTAFEPWITDIAERMQCPPDFPAVGAMVAAAGVIGRKVGIRPKRLDDWLVVPNLWGVLIGRPSMMKSPPLREVMRPVKQLIAAADRAHAEAMKSHAEHAQELALRKAAIETKVKLALRKNGPAEEELESLRGINSDLAAAPPPRRRYVVNDATVQALSEVMAENPNGVILVRDELIGFLKSLDMESQQAARAFYLEAWDGTGSFESDRIGRGNTRVEAVCLSLVGTCQPGPLGEYLAQAIRGGIGDDGFMQRFQLAVWPDDPGQWLNVDRIPDSAARDTAFAVFDRLDEFDAASIGAESDIFDAKGIPALRFDDAACERFVAWRVEHENRLRSGAEAPAMESHLTKYRSLIPSVALVSHLVDGGNGPVGIEALERAIEWGHYLELHARRVYSQGIEPGLPAARVLAQRLLDNRLPSGFVLRDAYRQRWSHLATRTDAAAAVSCLVDLDWLRPEVVATGGAPKTIYHLNPRVRDADFEPFTRD